MEEAGELGGQGHGVLVQEPAVAGLGHGLLEGVRGLEQGGQVGDAVLDGLEQLEARLPVQRPVLGELAVADHAEQVVLVAVDVGHRLFVGRGQEQLGPNPHGQGAGHAVHVLVLGQARGLLEDLGVQDGQVARVVADAVLDQQDHPGEAHRRVVGHIGPVLHELDHAHEDLGVAVPHEDLVVVPLEVLASAVQGTHFHVVVEEEVDGDARGGLAEGVGQLHVAALTHAAHDDDDVEVPGAALLQGLVQGGHVGHPGRVAHVQLVVAVEEDLRQQAVLLQREGIEGRGHQEDLPGAQGHEVVEDLLVRGVLAEDLVELTAEHAGGLVSIAVYFAGHKKRDCVQSLFLCLGRSQWLVTPGPGRSWSRPP